MPRRPDFSNYRAAPSVERYRDVVGRLFRGEEEVGFVLVLVEPYAETLSEHLWWRRWSPTSDALWLWVMLDGEFGDSFVQDGVDDEIEALDAGRFDYYGQQLRVEWTGPDESARLRTAQFGL